MSSRARSLAPLLFFLCVLFAGAVVAQDAPPLDDPQDGAPESEVPLPPGAQELEAIVVTGRQPGPGLWKVGKGDHVLWILGVQGPLPKGMEWDSANVERRIAASQEVLTMPYANFGADIGFFRGLTLLPSLFKARKNPDGKTLQDVVTPEQYARWSVLKARYIGTDRGVEEWRPLFAALELYRKAIARTGLSDSSRITDLVRKTARRDGVKVTDPRVEVKIADPKATLKEFSRTTLEDTECFAKTVERIEDDLGTMVERANAWAQGDIETLRAGTRPTQWAACSAAMTGSALARKAGIADIEAKVQAKWLETAESALARNASTFAVLPVSQLLADDGYLAKLAAKGYAIEEP